MCLWCGVVQCDVVCYNQSIQYHIRSHSIITNNMILHTIQIRDVLVAYMKSNNLEMDGGQTKAPTAITGDRTVLIAEVKMKHQNHISSFGST
jgi:hypothetical protein